MMIKIENFGAGSSQFTGTEKELFADLGFINTLKINTHLQEKGYCHLIIKEGDYEGSVAKFTVDLDSNYDGLGGNCHKRMYCRREERYNLRCYWSGRLSWKGKKNNPKFTMMNRNCEVLLDYEGDEVLKRFNLKIEGKKLLENSRVVDINGVVLEEGDEVLYVNLRYGTGAALCHGVIESFKAHAREGFVSVIVKNEDTIQEVSELKQPSKQIYKKPLDINIHQE